MKTPALQLQSTKHRDITVKAGVLTLKVAQAEWRIGLADKTIRDVAASLSEFIDVAKALEPYASLPARLLEFPLAPSSLRLNPNVRMDVNIEFAEPPKFNADALIGDDRPPIFRVIDPDDPDEDFLQIVQVNL